MPTFRLRLAYDGTEFAGSQVQPGQRTVQGELNRAFVSIGIVPVRTTFAGRTDREVHAIGQVASATMPAWRDTPEQLQRALQARLPRDLSATTVEICDPKFHPRFDATWREYRYRIAVGTQEPFVARYAYVLRHRMDCEAAQAAVGRLCGKHDFATFASGGQGVPSARHIGRRHGTTRTILRCECREVGLNTIASFETPTRLFELRVVADGFLPQMVRNIAGAVIEVGQGRRGSEWIDDLVAARDRRIGPSPAPAQGLMLWRVGFENDAISDW